MRAKGKNHPEVINVWNRLSDLVVEVLYLYAFTSRQNKI